MGGVCVGGRSRGVGFRSSPRATLGASREGVKLRRRACVFGNVADASGGVCVPEMRLLFPSARGVQLSESPWVSARTMVLHGRCAVGESWMPAGGPVAVEREARRARPACRGRIRTLPAHMIAKRGIDACRGMRLDRGGCPRLVRTHGTGRTPRLRRWCWLPTCDRAGLPGRFAREMRVGLETRSGRECESSWDGSPRGSRRDTSAPWHPR